MSTRLIKLSVLIVVTGVLSACLTAKQPVWITKAAEQYPAKEYLSASGSSDEQNTADSRALANLARIFEVAIDDSAMDFSEAIVSSQNGQRQINNEQRAARSVNTFTEQVLEGAQVVEHWRGESGPHYSLAILAKAPAADRLRTKINSLDKKTTDLRSYSAKQANNPVAALSALEQARKIQIQRAQHNRNLSVVSGKGIGARNNADSLETQIREALTVLRFDIDARPTQLDLGLQSAVNALGAQYFERSAYIVEGKMDTEPLQKKQGWYWLRGSVQLSLRKGDEVIAKQRWPIKVSAVDKGMVEQRAQDHLAAELPNYLFGLLTSAK